MIEARTMRSPVDGVVTDIKRDPSESVSVASPHVLTVVQIDKLAANLFLTPGRTEALKAGDQLDLLLTRFANAHPGYRGFREPDHRRRERHRAGEIYDR